MAARDCIAAIAAAAGRALSEDEIDRIVSEVQRRVERKLADGIDVARAADEAGRELAGEELLAAFIERRNAALNVRIRQQLDARVIPGREADSVRAMLTGFSGAWRRPGNFRGAAESVDALRHALRDQMQGGLLLDLERTGLLKAVLRRDASFDRDIAIEMWRLRDPASVRGTGSRQAEEVARILGKYQEALRGDLNKAGAWIGKLDNYVTRQSHDQDKIASAGFERWRDFILPRLDPETFTGREDPQLFLRRVFNALQSGVHTTSTDGALAGFQGPGSLAKRASAERVLHFKDPVSWWDYNVQFGRGRVIDSVLQGIDKGTRDLALMQMLGTNPEAMFKGWTQKLIAEAVDRGDVDTAKRLGRSVNDRILSIVTGEADRPDNVTWAKIGQRVRLMEGLAKLGGMVLSSVTDLGNNAAMLQHNGVSFLPRWAAVMRGLLPRSMEEREAAMSLGVGIDGMLGEVMHRFQAGENFEGKAAAAARLHYRWTGQTWWTDAAKTASGLMLSHNLAYHAEKSFDALPGRLQVTLRRYGIEAAEWQQLAAHAAEGADGNRYILPAHIEDQALARKAQTYIIDQVREGMSEPTAFDRLVVGGGLQRGTGWGEIVRTLMQFKQFAITYMDRSLGRELFRDGFDAGGLAHLIAAGWVLGYLAMTLKEVAKGRNPREWSQDNALKIAQAALAQSGGLGIYGDFLFGEYNRFGGGVIGTFAGPTAGSIEDVARLLMTIRDGEGHPAAEAIGLVKGHTPGVNLFYARALLDYAIFYRIQEWANPGYLRRMEQRVLRENKQTFWLRPTDAVR